MASYSNQIPAKLQAGDTIVLTGGVYTLPRGVYNAKVQGGSGPPSSADGKYANNEFYTGHHCYGTRLPSLGSIIEVWPSYGPGGMGGEASGTITVLGSKQISVTTTAATASFGAGMSLSYDGMTAAATGGGKGNLGTCTKSDKSVGTKDFNEYPYHGDVSFRTSVSVPGASGAAGTAISVPSGWSGRAGASDIARVLINVVSVNAAPEGLNMIAYGAFFAEAQVEAVCNVATDPDGDESIYVFEGSVDNKPFVTLGTTTVPRFMATVPKSGATWQIRVKAVDAGGAESAYVTGERKPIDYNKPPMIHATDPDLTNHRGPFEVSYTVSDPDGDTMERQTFLDNSALMMPAEALPDTPYLGSFGRTLWLKLPNGEHLFIMMVTDSHGATATHQVPFSRDEDGVCVRLEQGISCDQQPKTMVVNPDYTAHPSKLMVETCNNYNDEQPTWEDMSEQVRNGQKYTFVNEVKTAEQWCVNVRVTLEKMTPNETLILRSVDGSFTVTVPMEGV